MSEKQVINKEQFLEKYKKHQEWLADRDKGERLIWNFEIDFKFEFDFALNIRRADLRGADLIDADLSRADLSRADLDGANLDGANLRGANLRGADLINANLSRADLIDADLDYSCLPLWCGSKDVILCKNLQAQLLGHIIDACKEVEFTKEQIDFVYTNWSRATQFLGDRKC